MTINCNYHGVSISLQWVFSQWVFPCNEFSPQSIFTATSFRSYQFSATSFRAMSFPATKLHYAMMQHTMCISQSPMLFVKLEAQQSLYLCRMQISAEQIVTIDWCFCTQNSNKCIPLYSYKLQIYDIPSHISLSFEL